eukprot:TRINITY_DN40310_c0_g1_i1.p1 TRINITY_DN40310_c0_g1~~TRINITY_DN40310_c0_g1_i1.p1  ORF type:complete len:149 (-),score=31.53 TRINITY_DN40310_c0_g1_i1:12-458(-)
MVLTTSLKCLVGFAAVPLALVAATGIYRVSLVLMKKKRANQFSQPQDVMDEKKPSAGNNNPLPVRIGRAQLNALESLPIVATLILTAHVTGSSAMTDKLAPYLLGFRFAHAAIAIIPRQSARVVSYRFYCFLPQVLIMAYWGFKLLTN